MKAYHGWMCSTPIYEYKGWTFEYGNMGCWPLKKNGEQRKRAGNKFYAMLDEFVKLPYDQQKTFRVAGGCMRF